MSLGYSQQLVDANRRASKKSPGVKLGRECIKADVTVISIAAKLGVSRATIYKWFVGTCIPREKHVLAIDTLISQMQKRK